MENTGRRLPRAQGGLLATFSNCPRHARSKSSIILSFVRRRIHHFPFRQLALEIRPICVLIWRPPAIVLNFLFALSPLPSRFSLLNDRALSLLITLKVMNERAQTHYSNKSLLFDCEAGSFLFVVCLSNLFDIAIRGLESIANC